MGGFTKLHGSIIHSSVWQTPYHVRVVWVTMLAMADANGLVEASIGGLAKEAAVTRDECLESLESFLGPDPDSKNPDFEGRRIEEVTGGWFLLNHAQYRDRQTDAQIKAAERAKRYRQRRKERLEADASRSKEAESRHVTPVTDYPPEAEANSEADQKQKTEAGSRATKVAPPPESIELAQYLYDAVKSHDPEFMAGTAHPKLEAKLIGWAKHIDRLMRIDGKRAEEIRAVVDYAHRNERDKFWRGNLLSGQKLRDKFEQLAIKARSSGTAKPDYRGIDYVGLRDEMDARFGGKS